MSYNQSDTSSDNSPRQIILIPEDTELIKNDSLIEGIVINTQENNTPQPIKKNSKRVYWLDCLRIYASFLVILTHSAWYNLNREHRSWEFHVANVYQGSSIKCVPYFIMISGVFFLKPTKKLTYKLLFTKYIYRIFKCYVFWSIFYAFVYLHFIQKDFKFFLNKEVLVETIKHCFLGTDHLWYLNFVMGLYMATPIFRAVVADRDLGRYTALIILIIFHIVPTLTYLIDFHLGFENISVLKDFTRKFEFEVGGTYYIYYLLGYLFSTYDFKKKRNIYIMYAVGFISTFLTAFFYEYDSIKNGTLKQNMIKVDNINVVLGTLGGFIFFKYQINDWIQPFLKKKWFTKTIDVLSECSFGVYLWHLFILKVLSLHFKTTGSTFAGHEINTLIGIPIDTILTYIISFLLTYIMRKIPYVKTLV